jgi:hypothetical protein
MKKPIRDAIVEIGQSLDRMAISSMEHAKSHALNALKGDQKATEQAWAGMAKSEAYRLACEKVDDLRRALERGDIG